MLLKLNIYKKEFKVFNTNYKTAVLVLNMLFNISVEIVESNISPKIVKLARDRVLKDTFTVSDVLNYSPKEVASIFIIFAYLQLPYADFYAAVSSLQKR